MVTYDNEIYLNTRKESLNNTLNVFDISPVEVHSVATHSKPALGKKKLKQVEDVITKKLVSVLKVDQTELKEEYVQNNIAAETQSKANDLDYLVDCMKDKIKISNRRTRLQILTLVPNSWSLRKAAEVFSVSKSTIQKSWLLRDEEGIAEYPDLLKRQKLTEEIINKIKSFYCDDEFSRQLLGKNDSVSIGRNNHCAKRLLLCNLKELYATYRCTYPENKIGFSKFASLRPKWCTLVEPKGSHSVCVRAIHQNLKLMLSATGLEKSYHTLIER